MGGRILVIFLSIGISTTILGQTTDFRLWGTAYTGSGGLGSIYSINPDGSGFINSKSFLAPQGTDPMSMVKGNDGFIYGTCLNGGANGAGTLFKINADGTGFTKLYDFPRYSDDVQLSNGSNPTGKLLLASNGVLYGSTRSIIYSIHTDGTSFKKIFNYADVGFKAPVPGGLIQAADGDLYGISGMPTATAGTLFKIKLDGTGFTKILDINTLASQVLPFAENILPDPIQASDGDLLIGTLQRILKVSTDGLHISTIASKGTNTCLTNGGDGYYYGLDTNGKLFKIKSDGSNYQVLTGQFNTFPGLPVFLPSQSGFILGSDGYLYTNSMVSSTAIIKIKTDGTGFQKIIDLNYNFSYSLVESSNGVFLSAANGVNPALSFIYKVTSTGTLSVVKEFPDEPYSPRSELVKGIDGDLYGITEHGGANGFGTFFKIRTDGTTFTKLYDFDNINGANPGMPFVQLPNGDFIGTAVSGGPTNGGTIFKLSSNGNLTKFHDFLDIQYWERVQGLMLATDGDLYGVTGNGGATNNGSVFKIKVDGTGFSEIYSFTNTDGQAPQCPHLIQLSDGYLYGTASLGGINNNGTLFKISTTGSGFTKLLDFDGINSGSQPRSSLTYASNGFLYGMTTLGGTANAGVIFRIKPDGTGFQKLFDFDGGVNGLTAFRSPLTEAPDGFLYGTTEFGGLNGLGILFKIKLDGTSFTKILDFSTTTGGNPVGGISIITSPANKMAQTITFEALSNKLVTDPSFSLIASSNSGLPITYSSSNTQVATISGNTVTITGSGTTMITARQNGNSNFLQATDISQTLQVNKVSQAITFGSLSDKLSTDPSFTLGATSSSSLPITYASSNTQVATISGNSVTLKGAGSTTITASQAGNSTFLAATDVNQTLTVKLVTGDLNSLTTEDVVIYPNPSTNNLIIGLKGFSKSEYINIDIYDATGKVHDTRDVSNEESVIIGVRDYVKGMYFVKVTYKGAVYTRKFIKE